MKEYVKSNISNKNMGKSNSIVTNMIVDVSTDNKFLKEKRINDDLSGLGYLYEIDYFDNPLEKIHFNENIKEIVNGLLDAILFLQKEKELKLKETQYYKMHHNKKKLVIIQIKKLIKD